ncbi:MAG: sulfite exporter TauE/SafE family protein [Chloroflexota bacterium]|nr:sulfite exporter TauE/SafE family protein [Chloroflexota bacterium]
MRSGLLRRGALLVSAVLLSLVVVSPTAAHPLGNFTVNRAIDVVVASSGISLDYVTDMAEIPAFAALQAMDRDHDGSASAAERMAFAEATCRSAAATISVQVDSVTLPLRSASQPGLSFPPGAGGLETLRLVCPLVADLSLTGSEHRLTVADLANDGHLGWHEVVISSGEGATITSSSAPSHSPSTLLTAYPKESLDAPLNIRSGDAAWRIAAGQAASITDPQPAAGTPRSSAGDPLAALAAGNASLPGLLLGLLLAIGLGALHAVSPGHGKTLVAAYLIGSRGTVRQAAGLGLTVAVTHTAGVFLLGLVMLVAGEFLVPERVIGWLSAGSGLLVVGLGIGLVIRAIGRRGHGHSHASADHTHEHPHPHHHAHASTTPDQGASLRARNVVALGLAGGMVPSASALIVLLVAVSTGRLLLGMTLIVAFGVGMAVVLGGLAVATTWLRSRIAVRGRLTDHPWVRRVAGWVPLASGAAVAVAGAALAISAVTRLG